MSTAVAALTQCVAHEVTRRVQESLVKVVRHGGAADVRLASAYAADALRLTLGYQGRGFTSFKGRHDLASLQTMKAGPQTLKEPVSALGDRSSSIPARTASTWRSGCRCGRSVAVMPRLHPVRP
jgi:signal transduction histidine kinase